MPPIRDHNDSARIPPRKNSTRARPKPKPRRNADQVREELLAIAQRYSHAIAALQSLHNLSRHNFMEIHLAQLELLREEAAYYDYAQTIQREESSQFWESVKPWVRDPWGLDPGVERQRQQSTSCSRDTGVRSEPEYVDRRPGIWVPLNDVTGNELMAERSGAAERSEEAERSEAARRIEMIRSMRFRGTNSYPYPLTPRQYPRYHLAPDPLPPLFSDNDSSKDSDDANDDANANANTSPNASPSINDNPDAIPIPIIKINGHPI